MSQPGHDQIRIACAVEHESYVPHCAAMLHSVLAKHRDTPIRIDYLHGDDTKPRRRAQLKRMVAGLGGDIVFHAIPDPWVTGLPTKGFTGKATWYRMFLPELLPDADRVLYLDVDLLVLDSLTPLWRTSLNGHLLGAVTNVMMKHDLGRAAWIGLPGKDHYFNAGVVLMDLAKMREERTMADVMSFARQHPQRIGWRDQDALNLVLHDRRLALHPRWNCMNSIMNFPWALDYFPAEVLDEARRRPAIRHFEGPDMNKPWHLLCETQPRRLYAQHRRHTPWPRIWPSGCTPGNLLRYTRNRTSASHG